jgi:hypothetical protein
MAGPLDEFAQRLITSVRDEAIRSCDALAQGSVGGALGERWRATLGSATAAEAMRELLPDVVDQVLFHLLDAIDNDRLPLAWPDGSNIRPLEELGQGEMGGLLMMGEDGWIDRYSSQRHFDPLAGLGE